MKRILISLALLMAGFPLLGQDLLHDGIRLLEAIDILQDSSRTPQEHTQAADVALTILYLYDEPAQTSPPQYIETAWLFDHLQKNDLLNGLIPKALQQKLAAGESHTLSSVTALWDSLQSKPRKKITTLLYEGAPVSPSEYLSVRQALTNSAAPPLAPETTLKRQAEQMFQPPSLTDLRTEALLQGLFQFILDKARQEVAVLYLDKLLDKQLPNVNIIFPHVAKQYRDGVTNYSTSFIEGLREAFFLDLKQLSITLPELMLTDAYFGKLRSKPVYFNLLAVYNLYSMAQQSTGYNEALPVTHRFLYQQYENNRQALYQELAANATTTPAYREVQQLSGQYIARLNGIVKELLTAQKQLQDTVELYKSKAVRQIPAPNPRRYLNNPLFRYAVLMGTEADTTSLGLDFLPDLLNGAFDSTKLSQYNTLKDYDRLFSHPRTPVSMRIAGLELVRNLNGSWHNELSQADILRRWQRTLMDYETAVIAWKVKLDSPSLATLIQRANTERVQLEQRIQEMQNYWQGCAKGTDQQALSLLADIVDAEAFQQIDMNPNYLLDPAGALAERQQLLQGVTIRLRAFDDRMAAQCPDKAAGSPMRKPAPAQPRLTKASAIPAAIEQLNELNVRLQRAMDSLELQHARTLHQTLNSARPIVQLTEMASQFLFALETPDGLISIEQLDSAVTQPRLRQACLGLLQQRLSKVKGIGFISPQGIAELATATLQDLVILESPLADTLHKKWYLGLFAAVQSINRLSSYPILPDPQEPGTYTSLAARVPTLQLLPTVSTLCMNFLYYLGDDQHKSAMNALRPLLKELTLQADSLGGNPGGRSQRLSMLAFFGEYGAFIAGMVDASSRQEVEYLLSTLSDPPGSSRTKRQKSFCVSLNAYMGGMLGYENLTREENGQTFSSGYEDMASLNIPVGITVSRRLGKGKRAPSFGLHLSVLDLGSMLTYRFSPATEYGGYKLTFKNVFKPGVQLHYNIPKSPFYFGAGWQSGAEFREIAGEEITLRSSRFFIGLGVDITIKNVYSK